MNIHGFHLQIDLASRDPCHVEKVLDQFCFEFQVAPDHLQVRPRAAGGVILLHQRCNGCQRGRKRRAQFVTENGDELILGAIRSFGGFLGGLEIALHLLVPGNVAKNTDHVALVFEFDAGGVNIGVKNSAIGAFYGNVCHKRHQTLRLFCKALHNLRERLLRVDVCHGQLSQLLFAIAEHLAETLVRKIKAPVRQIDHRDTIGYFLKKRSEFPLAGSPRDAGADQLRGEPGDQPVKHRSRDDHKQEPLEGGPRHQFLRRYKQDAQKSV